MSGYQLFLRNFVQVSSVRKKEKYFNREILQTENVPPDNVIGTNWERLQNLSVGSSGLIARTA